MRGRIILLVFFVLTPLVLVRYFQLQVIQSEELTRELQEMSFYRRKLPAERGEIRTRDGALTAWSEKVKMAWLPGRLKVDYERLEKILGKKRFMDLILGEEIPVSDAEADILRDMGIPVYEKMIRKYSGLAPHVTGYARAGKGVYGIEKEYDDVLRGVSGAELFVVDARGKVIGEVLRSPPIKGEDITLTIDSRLQQAAQKLLEGKRGVIIMEDVKSGEILALASSPSFDPRKISPGLSDWEWRKILNDPSGMFINRAISALYPPGSSIKPFIAFSYLMKFKGKINVLRCRGRYEYVGKSGRVLRVYKDWLLSGHGLVDLKKAIRVSCNVYFYTIGQKVGIDFLSEMAKKVGLADLTGIDLPGERKGIFPSRKWKQDRYGQPWYPGDTILLSIGQGYVSLTPFQLLTFYTILANDGVAYRPHVVKKLGERDVKKEILRKVDAPKWVWDFLREAMVEVTSWPGGHKSGGTAYKVFKGFEVTVAGKTGTAEVPGKRPHSWFIGYAPARDPKVAVLVIVENGGAGSEMAAPLARKMLEEYFSLFPVYDTVKGGNEEER